MRKHYKKDGTVFKGGVHKMPNGQIHYGELSKKSQAKARTQRGK